MEMLTLFNLIDSFYGLALWCQIYRITRWIPATQHVRAWQAWALTSFENLWNVVRPTLLVSGFHIADLRVV